MNDPWRKVDPVRAPVRPTEEQRERVDVLEIDHDADLAIPGNYVIRSAHTCFNITSTRVHSPKDALDVLAECIIDVSRIKTVGDALLDAGIGTRCRKRSWNVPENDTPASVFKGGETTLWFVQMPIDPGMLVLARILRMPEAAVVCKKHGIAVMLNA